MGITVRHAHSECTATVSACTEVKLDVLADAVSRSPANRACAQTAHGPDRPRTCRALFTRSAAEGAKPTYRYCGATPSRTTTAVVREAEPLPVPAPAAVPVLQTASRRDAHGRRAAPEVVDRSAIANDDRERRRPETLNAYRDAHTRMDEDVSAGYIRPSVEYSTTIPAV